MLELPIKPNTPKVAQRIESRSAINQEIDPIKSLATLCDIASRVTDVDIPWRCNWSKIRAKGQGLRWILRPSLGCRSGLAQQEDRTFARHYLAMIDAIVADGIAKQRTPLHQRFSQGRSIDVAPILFARNLFGWIRRFRGTHCCFIGSVSGVDKYCNEAIPKIENALHGGHIRVTFGLGSVVPQCELSRKKWRLCWNR